MPVQTASMKGKTVVITGASTGIGRVTALELAKAGATVVMVSRDPARAEAAWKEARAVATGGQPEMITADLSALSEIHRVAHEILAHHERLDVLVNNAGIVLTERKESVDGFEMTFALNHLGYYVLTDLLLPLLKKSAPARIINVASEGHRAGRIKFDDLQAKKSFIGIMVYCDTKLMNVLHANELARRLEGTGVTANSVHPGPVASNWGQGASGFFHWGHVLSRPFQITPEKGAETMIYLASSPEVAGATGKYWAKCREKTPTRTARNADIAKNLWDVSAELTRPK